MKYDRHRGIPRYKAVLKTKFSAFLFSFFVCFFSAAHLTGCEAQKEEMAERNFFAMDTVMQIRCYGKNCEAAADEAAAEIIRLEKLLSVGTAESETSRINASGGSAVLSDDVRLLIEKSLDLYRMTEGSFDITVLPLMELWGFPSGNYAVPESEELKAALLLCGSDRIQYGQTQGIKLDKGQGIDFGGIAKGYASDRLAGIFEKYNLSSAYASLGGNIYCYKRTEGRKWRIAVQNPLQSENGGGFIGVVEVEDEAVVTSGGYERYFTDEATGRTYHHILDPSTGYPAQSGLISVTVVSGSGTLADGLSTACYIMGLDKSTELWRRYGEGEEAFGLILMTAEGTVYVTEDLAGRFSSEFETKILYK